MTASNEKNDLTENPTRDDFPKKKRTRGVSALRIINHRKVHEIYHRLVKEAGKFSTKLSKSDFADLIADETGYSTITVNQILNKKEPTE